MRLSLRSESNTQFMMLRGWFGGLLLAWIVSAAPAIAQDSQDDGEDLLDEAIQLQLEADTPRDYDKIADLCEEAIDAGLSDESTATAKQMWASACLEYAQSHAERVFSTPQDPRWQFLRQQALKRLEKAVELNPQMAEAHLAIAQYNLLPGGDRMAAEAAIAVALENLDDDPSRHAMAIVLRAQTTEDLDKKLEDLGKALEIDPANSMALNLRGNIYLEQGKTEEAIADFRTLAEAEGNNPLILVLLAEKLVEGEKYDEALQVIDQALEVKSDLAPALLIRARAHLGLDKDEEAIEDVSRVLELEPRNLDALRLRANARYSLKKYDEALKDVEKILAFDPQNGNVILLRAFVYTAMEKYDPAIEDMEMLVAGNPDDPQLKNTLAMIYNSAKRPRRAIGIYNELLGDDPRDASALRGRGDAQLSMGEHKLAIEDYESALKLDEEDDGVLNNLAWVLATSTFDELRDGKRALELALKAAELTDHKEAHVLSTLAAAYAENGDFENAVKWSEKSVEIAEPGRQSEDLNKELETFRSGKPVRERETVEEETDEDDEGDKPADDDGKGDEGGGDEGGGNEGGTAD